MTKENHEPLQNTKPLNPWLVGLLMGILSFVAPINFGSIESRGSTFVSVSGISWSLIFGAVGWKIEVYNLLEPWIFLMVSQLIVPRLLFAYQMMRYYQEKTTRKRTLAVGVFAELPMVALVLFDFLQQYIINRWISIQALPVASLLVIGMLLIRFFPAPSKPVHYFEKDTRKWWLENGPGSQ